MKNVTVNVKEIQWWMKAYAMTGRQKYLDKARRLIKAWKGLVPIC